MPPNRDADETDDGAAANTESGSSTDAEPTDDTENGAPTESDEAGDSPTTTVGPAEVPTPEGEPPGIEPLDERLPALTPDSRWWYWIAAVPAYFLLSTLLAFGVFLLVLTGLALDSGITLFVLFVFAFLLIGLPGVVLSVLFPLATYADARAIAGADVEWTPDPILYGLLALAAVLMTAFTLSVPLALYYLYQRHRYVGTP
jgi:hypothetical protein